MGDSEITVKILTFLAAAIGTAFVTGIVVGEQRKARWFRKRTKQSFFLRRGAFGEACHFGYPCTKEGIGVTLVMAAVIVGLFFMIFL